LTEVNGLELALDQELGETSKIRPQSGPNYQYSNSNIPSTPIPESSNVSNSRTLPAVDQNDNLDLPRRNSQEVAVSQTDNSVVESIHKVRALQAQSQNENEPTFSKPFLIVSQSFNAPFVKASPANVAQESRNPTKNAMTTRDKISAFFKGRKEEIKAPTTPSNTVTIRESGKTQPSASSSTSNMVGVHFRVGKRMDNRSSFVTFEGANVLTGDPVAIMFVCARYFSALPLLVR
jgi:hypothetical protein